MPRLLVGFLTAALAGIVAAAPPPTPEEAEAQRRLESVRAQIAELAAQRTQLDDARGAATRAVREADAAVAEAVRTAAATEAEIAAQETSIQALDERRGAMEASLADQRAQLAALLRSAYALGRHEQLKLLLAQDRVADLARVLAYHRYLQADRTQRIDGLIDELRALAEVVAEAEAARAALAAARERQQAELDALEDQRAERARAVAALDREFADTRSRLDALGRDEEAIVALLEKLRDVLADVPEQVDDTRAFRSRRGELRWPLDAPVRVGYGGRLPDGRESQGLLLAAGAGTEVRAVAPGRVAFADWLKGYGLIVILDHGDGWMSLYANNDGLLRESGDWVRAGAVLSTVGSSGGQAAPALYLELRHDGKPVDPRPWFAPR
ncbi:murein hydrolase activator EnvC family protein [Coralloluteibacterium stylophorae]|uniref:Peptidoglycan DD-metalloendopeptidase family protein n=2 Tax=Coralloluteibacterium stylophorae TaxID=1776034 RepID=A0AAP2CCZ4_9GAMM|nr:peptidoglycan DD-metalloendopeptidase family protein [Coralloluteibacterium stylophorae]MBS7458074.1 peptidoglycan DD-metalloendopeptidase family protein [Coralloluteibacterium stylophorae]